MVLILTAMVFVPVTGCIVSPGAASTAPPSSVPASVSLASVDQAWNIIQQDYVDKTKIDNSNMSGAAIKAMLDTLHDPYTVYMDPQTYTLDLSSMSGQFEGIGATVTEDNSTAKVVSVVSGSPAEKAGVKAGDVILAVNGVPTQGMSLNDVILRVRGPQGTSVTLSIQHAGESTPVDIAIIRQAIQMTTVKSQMKGDIAYISISSFAENTDDELASALAVLPQQKATGIIIDLRGNPGGLLQTVVADASHFLKPGDLVVDVVDNKGNHQPSNAVNTSVTTNLPVVILVDGHSASGSEVLSGALKDYKRATIAGTKTYGKGSVDILRELQDGSAIYITIARWLTPSGQAIEGKGIEPDVTLTITGDDEINWAIDYLHSSKGTVESVPDVVYG